MSYGLVWFKRDLRWEDHAALAQAAKLGPIRCIYVIEPELWLQPDVALQHFEFIRESLHVLDAHLRAHGGGIEIHTGELTQVLTAIWNEAPFTGLYSHQETGNGWTYQRDLQVADWCRKTQVIWHEFAQFGVVRKLKSRNQWQSAWERHMTSPLQHSASLTFWSAPCSEPLVMQAPAHLRHDPPQRQRGGRTRALAILQSFLNARSLGYRGGISSPCLPRMRARDSHRIWHSDASACVKSCN